MSIKNLKSWINLKDATWLLFMGITVGCFISSEFYDEQEQIVDNSFNHLVDNVDGDDQFYHEFLPGEHRIKRTRIDSFGYETESIDGYMIENVTLKWSGNKNIITYVNTLPVVVHGAKNKDGVVTFDDFGEVITKESIKSYK